MSETIKTCAGKMVAKAEVLAGCVVVSFTDGSRLRINGTPNGASVDFKVTHENTERACARCAGTGWVYREAWGDEPCHCNAPTYRGRS